MILAFFAACTIPVIPTHTSEDFFPNDDDQDGYTNDEGDCNDDDRAIHPGATEIYYDGVDQNCDGLSDDDADGDGVNVNKDCDDANPHIYPDAEELCDGVDNNCDDDVDSDAEGALTAYADADADGWAERGADEVSVCSDTAPAGYTFETGDCDDSRRDVAPDALEYCDGADNDCDGETDEDGVDAVAYYQDADGDGFGTPDVFVAACEGSDGWVDNATDCDDADANSNPDADEYCDGLDNDCDGRADESAEDRTNHYPDADGDGYGDASDEQYGCLETGRVLDNTDCDDADAANFPGNTEACDAADNDCDAVADNGLPSGALYADTDGDGHGNSKAAIGVEGCESAGASLSGDDCNDSEPLAYSGATEVCDGVDNDCEGTTDENAVDGMSFWLDADGDSYGFGEAIIACDVTGEYTAMMAGDCNDAEALAWSGAADNEDGVDNDCDAMVDEDAVLDGDLVITEIARQPSAGTGSVVENAVWFELYNQSARDVNLSGWSFTRDDASGADEYIDLSGVTITAGDYLVFCSTNAYDSSIEPSSSLVCDYVYGSAAEADDFIGEGVNNAFDLGVAADILSLSADGRLLDTVRWADDGVWPNLDGSSMQLSSTMLDITSNDAAISWCFAATTWFDNGSGAMEFGTPGAANEECI